MNIEEDKLAINIPESGEKKKVEVFTNDIQVDMQFSTPGDYTIGFKYPESLNIDKNIHVESPIPSTKVLMDEVITFDGEIFPQRYTGGHGSTPHEAPTILIPKMEINKDDFYCNIFTNKLYQWSHYPGSYPAGYRVEAVTIYPPCGTGVLSSDETLEDAFVIMNLGIITDKIAEKYLGSYIMLEIETKDFSPDCEYLKSNLIIGSIASEVDLTKNLKPYQVGFGVTAFTTVDGGIYDYIKGLGKFCCDQKELEEFNKHWSWDYPEIKYFSAKIPIRVRIEVPQPTPQYIIRSVDEFNTIIPKLLQENNNDLSLITIAIMDNDGTNSNNYRFPNTIIKSPARIIKQNGNYSNMFKDCVNMTWVSPYIIWRVTRTIAGMFEGCVGITSELPTNIMDIRNTKLDITKSTNENKEWTHHPIDYSVDWTNWCKGCINVANKDVLAEQITGF